MNLLAGDPGLMQEHPEPYVYRCRKCRRLLASKSNLITHKPKDALNAQDGSHESPLARQRSTLETSEIERNIDEITEKVLETTLNEKPHKDQPICTKTFFVEPIAWMKDITLNVEGKLYCPSCKSKIGSFNWTMASKCPCGAQVSPSFYFIPSKVEYSNIVQNMKQVTVWIWVLLPSVTIVLCVHVVVAPLKSNLGYCERDDENLRASENREQS